MVEYQGAHGILEVDDVAFAVAEFTVKSTRGTAVQPRSGTWSDLELPGKVAIAGTFKRILIDGKMLGMLIGTASAGASVTLHAGVTAPGVAGENVTDMSPTAAQSSHIKFTALTDAVTAEGHVIIYGTDVNDNSQIELVTIPVMDLAATVTSTKVFKSVTHVVGFEWVQATGTLKVDAITGDTTYSIGEPTYFKLKGKLVKGSDHVYITMNNCYLIDGEFGFTDANAIVNDSLSYKMKDPDADLSIATTG